MIFCICQVDPEEPNHWRYPCTRNDGLDDMVRACIEEGRTTVPGVWQFDERISFTLDAGRNLVRHVKGAVP